MLTALHLLAGLSILSLGSGQPSGLFSSILGVPARTAKASEAPKDTAEPLSLPAGFFIGAGSSAYQIEGAWNISGKGLSTTDVAYSNRSDGGGNLACDSYHRYEEDIKMLKLMGASHYRFSLAWARLLPTGEPDNVNPDGLRYYNDLINKLKAAGIEPVVTLWHVDLPAAIEQAFGGFQDKKIVDYFDAYAKLAFTSFGDRVKIWTTMNEPHMFCVYGAGQGRMGATHVQPGYSEYRCAHNMLLAHARAYHSYKTQFAAQGGMVGMSMNNFFTKPCSQWYDDVLAAERHQQFEVGWYLEPLLMDGEYPPMMRARVPADRLPAFSEDEKKELKGSLDFIGMNVYYGWTACDGRPSNAKDPSYQWDQSVTIPESSNMNLPPGDFQWSPWSIRSALLWVRDRYQPKIPFIITENGYGTDGSDGTLDDARIAYHSAYLRELLSTIKNDKVNVIGYFVWSLLDDFEWGVGYSVKLGLTHVDFSSPELTRSPKKSLYFFKNVTTNKTVPLVERPSSKSPALTATIMILITSLLFVKLFN